MDRIIRILEETAVQYMATVGLDGNPKVRPFAFAKELNKKLYYSTSRNRNVYEELNLNPNIEIAASYDDHWLRMRGVAAFVTDPSVKASVFSSSLMLKRYFTSSTDPAFILFSIDKGVATISKAGQSSVIVEF